MDTGEGTFKKIDAMKAQQLIKDEYPLGIFKVGEELTIKGSRFRVKSLKLKEMRLKLLPQQ